MDYLQFSLLDMTPYDRQSWFNLIKGYQQAIWPIQLPALALSGLLLWLGFSHRTHRTAVTLLILASAWLWCGWVFHMHYFIRLNWAADAFGGLFIGQAGLLFVLAIISFRIAWRPTWSTLHHSRGRIAGLTLVLGLLLYPLAGLFEGRTLLQLEGFALMPTPTVITTIAVSMLLQGWLRFVLLIIPFIWSVIGAAFAWTLGLLEFYALSLTLGLWLVHLFLGAGDDTANENPSRPES